MRFFVIIFFCILFPGLILSQDSREQQNVTGLSLSFPWANSYLYYDYELNKKTFKSGFGGFGASLFHLRGKNRYSINTGFTMDAPYPIGPIDYGNEGTRSTLNTYFVEGLYHRHVFWQFYIFGGITYQTYRYHLLSFIDTIPSYTKENSSLGLSIGPEYKSKRSFRLALFYRPLLYSFQKSGYQHHLSLDFRFDINLKKK